jgi:hypothetical protein
MNEKLDQSWTVVPLLRPLLRPILSKMEAARCGGRKEDFLLYSDDFESGAVVLRCIVH